MKRFISCVLVLIIILALSSCTGIGGGALFRGEKTDSRNSSNSDTENSEYAGICKAGYYTADGTLLASFALSETETNEIYRWLTTAPGDNERVRTDGMKLHFMLTFEGTDIEYRIDSDDYVHMYDHRNGDIDGLGHMDGMYNRLGELSNIIDFKSMEYDLECRAKENSWPEGREPFDAKISGDDADELYYILTSEEYGRERMQGEGIKLTVSFSLVAVGEDHSNDMIFARPFHVYENDVVFKTDSYIETAYYRYIEGIYDKIMDMASDKTIEE